MKHFKQKVSNNNQGGGVTTKNKIKIDDKEITDTNKSIDWKKEREYLFSKIKTLEKEVPYFMNLPLILIYPSKAI